MIDLRQTEEYNDYMRALDWHVVELKTQNSHSKSRAHVKTYVRKVPLIGNIAKLQRPQVLPTTKQLERLAKEHNLAALYVEPITNNQLPVTRNYFLNAKNSFVPAKTIHIDLTKSEDDLLKDMKHKTRYNIKQAQKRSVAIKESTDIEEFIKLWQKSARRRGMFLPQKKEIRALYRAFGKSAHLLLANHFDITLYRSEPLGGVLLVRTPEVGYYMYAASTKEGNKLFAPTLLAWEAIKLAKEKGCRVFDFEGIYDERYPETKTWQGFTRFKKGFGGKTVTYPRTLVKYYNPIIRLFRL